MYRQGDGKVSDTPVCFQLPARLTTALVVFVPTHESVAVDLTSRPAAGHREQAAVAPLTNTEAQPVKTLFTSRPGLIG